MNVEVQTFGCKVNSYDSGLLQGWLKDAGFTLAGETPQLHVLNSCAVTAEATRQVLRQARKLKNQNSECVVVVTGCSAQVDTELIAGESAVDLVVANSHKGELAKLVGEHLAGRLNERVFKSGIFKKEDLEAGGGTELGHTRSFLKIQDGCDSFCTFCVIPFARGKSRSIEPQLLSERINELSDQGVAEFVITGVHIGDYRSEDGGDLAKLIEHLLVHSKAQRLRLSSLEPIELSDQLMDLYADARLCRHFHISLQSASSTVLARMKRAYGQDEVATALRKIDQRVPDSYVGMDIIAGFPEESDEEFNESMALLKDLPWTRMHVFPYSERPGTYAARAFEGVASTVIKERAKILRELSRERHLISAMNQVGQIKQVLGLRSGNAGVARDYWSVQATDLKPGMEHQVRITGCDREETPHGDVHLYGVSCAGR